MNANSKFNFSGLPSKAFFVSLLIGVMLFSCFLFSMFSTDVSPFVLGASNQVVSNELELRNAINNAVGSTVIALDKDITLTEQLSIPVDKNITLTSTSTSKFFKLIGGDVDVYFAPDYWPHSGAVISVEDGAVLKLDGIFVSNHVNYYWIAAVRVGVSGTFILYTGEISGAGVSNYGNFTMFGGTISNCNGNGVSNSEYGTFSMVGGEVSNNTGYGVYNHGTYNWGWTYGTFSMSGGVIRNNDGGGVQNTGIFSMVGGEISNNVGGNIMHSGGGVSNSGVFSMSGGAISNNQATYGGGVYNWPDGNFSLSGNGVISNNIAEVGGGVYNAGTFNRRDGVISGNTATQYDNIYPDDDSTTKDNSITGYVLLVVSIVVIASIIVVSLFFYFRRCKNNLHK